MVRQKIKTVIWEDIKKILNKLIWRHVTKFIFEGKDEAQQENGESEKNDNLRFEMRMFRYFKTYAFLMVGFVLAAENSLESPTLLSLSKVCDTSVSTLSFYFWSKSLGFVFAVLFTSFLVDSLQNPKVEIPVRTNGLFVAFIFLRMVVNTTMVWSQNAYVVIGIGFIKGIINFFGEYLQSYSLKNIWFGENKAVLMMNYFFWSIGAIISPTVTGVVFTNLSTIFTTLQQLEFLFWGTNWFYFILSVPFFFFNSPTRFENLEEYKVRKLDKLLKRVKFQKRKIAKLERDAKKMDDLMKIKELKNNLKETTKNINQIRKKLGKVFLKTHLQFSYSEIPMEEADTLEKNKHVFEEETEKINDPIVIKFKTKSKKIQDLLKSNRNEIQILEKEIKRTEPQTAKNFILFFMSFYIFFGYGFVCIMSGAIVKFAALKGIEDVSFMILILNIGYSTSRLFVVIFGKKIRPGVLVLTSFTGCLLCVACCLLIAILEQYNFIQVLFWIVFALAGLSTGYVYPNCFLLIKNSFRIDITGKVRSLVIVVSGLGGMFNSLVTLTTSMFGVISFVVFSGIVVLTAFFSYLIAYTIHMKWGKKKAKISNEQLEKEKIEVTVNSNNFVNIIRY